MHTPERYTVLPYRGALGNVEDGRRWFSPRAAVAGLAVLVTAAAMVVLIPAADQVSADFGATRTSTAAGLVRAAEAGRDWRSGVAGAAAVLVFAVVSGVRRRRVEPEAHLGPARWRLAFATTLFCGGVALVTAVVMALPLVQLHRELTTSVTATDGVRTFATASSLYRYIATEQLGPDPTPDEVLRVAAGAAVEYHPWGNGQLWVIAPSDYFDPDIPHVFGYFRGVQGNGSYYLVVQRADGVLDLLGEAGGNHYELRGDGPGATLSTSWHMGAAARVDTVYRFDGRRFAQVSERTETTGDE